MTNHKAIEKIKDLRVKIKAQHMCKSMDGECTKEDVQEYKDEFEALLMAEKALKDVPDTNVGKWIPCRERLPENEQEVEITYVKKHWKTGEPLYFTCRAFYSDGTVNTKESNYVWDETDNWEYIEKMDAYIIPEGWWECVSFAEEFAAVDMPVIAWMPLPEAYKGETE